MKRIYAAASVLTILGMLTTGGSAYTDVAYYDMPSGPGHLVAGDTTVQPWTATRPCASEWEDWDEGVFEDTTEEEPHPHDDVDDTVGQHVLTPVFTTTCGAGREARFGDPGSDNGVVNVGIYSEAIRAPADDHTVFTATAYDHVSDAPFFTLCVITADSSMGADPWCGDETDGMGEPTDANTRDHYEAGCGSNTVDTGDVPAGHSGPIVIAIYGAHLDAADLEPCFASAGHVEVVMT